jgi:NADH:ubiquinone oxidoreductase subunit 5 (subunit L)/multisubunit Na+/H+ antiporter MnhA subunit
LGANFEYDLKKFIALSTSSELGLIIGAVSVGFVDLAFFFFIY